MLNVRDLQKLRGAKTPSITPIPMIYNNPELLYPLSNEQTALSFRVGKLRSGSKDTKQSPIKPHRRGISFGTPELTEERLTFNLMLNPKLSMYSWPYSATTAQ